MQDALVWNIMYTVRGRRAIFGAVNLWCSLYNIDVKINRIGTALCSALLQKVLVCSLAMSYSLPLVAPRLCSGVRHNLALS